MITKEQREQVRQDWRKAEGYDLRYGASVEALEAASSLVEMIPAFLAAMEEFDEMEKERDMWRAQQADAVREMQEAKRVALDLMKERDEMAWRARLDDRVLAYFSDVSVAEKMTRGMDASGLLVERIK